MDKKEIDWGMDIAKKNKQEQSTIITLRLPVKYKEFVTKENISPAKLFMRACEMLNNSLKE